MNFTKEYIKEADCEEIQGLKRELCKGDYVEHGGNKWIIEMKDIVWERGSCVWLPTGDQLDEEIVKICREKRYDYEIFYNPDTGRWITNIDLKIDPTHDFIAYSNDANPLIAKILLLKNLLEKEKNDYITVR
jgi:hypothetical protein